MDLTGRWPRLGVDRPLREAERRNRLDIRRRFDVEPEESFSTIKMNSTYLEVVDKCYYWRGLSLLFALPVLPVLFCLSVAGPWLSAKLAFTAPLLAAFGFAFTVFAWHCLYRIGLPMLAELFDLTHNPIRLNRRNRTLYAFSYRSGTVVSAPWDGMLFTVFDASGAGSRGAYCMLMGHILSEDGVSVVDTILFARTTRSPERIVPYWEYLRRYMEEGPEKLLPLVERCLPLDEKKEPPLLGWKLVQVRLLACFAYPLWLCRRLAMYTSKVPRWPEWVEEECAVSPDDRFVRTGEQDSPLTGESRLPYNANVG